MRIVIDFKNIQKKWFEIIDFKNYVNILMNEIKCKYGNDIDIFAVLYIEKEMEYYFESLEPYFKREQIKTKCFYPELIENSVQDIIIEKLFNEWFFGQFDANIVLTPKYEDVNSNDTGWFDAIDKMIDPKKIEKKEFLLSLSKYARCRDDNYLELLATSIEDSTLFIEKHMIYIDMSITIIQNCVTGIQRVTNAYVTGIKNLLKNVVDIGCQPIYSNRKNDTYFYVSCNNGHYKKQEYENGVVKVSFHDGDILFIPDLKIGDMLDDIEYLKHLKYRGIKIFSYIHDLFPLYYPETNLYDIYKCTFEDYLYLISNLSGVIANSKTTLQNYLCWCKDCDVKLPSFFVADVAYLGFNIVNANSTKGLPVDYISIMNKIESATTLLMVGSIAPRKNHELVLDALELLWKTGENINLIFVGSNGWNMEEFMYKIENYDNDHFMWLKDVSDEFLDKIYNKVDGVIYISEDEGYGLPIVEAAKYDKPLLLRNIEIFREIAGDNATYYNGCKDPFLLANTIDKWVSEIKIGKAVTTKGIKKYTWEESSKKVLDILLS